MSAKRKISLYIMALLYIASGINHFLNTAIYMGIMPPWLPEPLLLVYTSGVCEMVLGGLLLWKQYRHIAAWGIILLLVAIFPANIQMAINYSREHNPFLWVSILRLPLQLVLIWWAYQFTKKGK